MSIDAQAPPIAQADLTDDEAPEPSWMRASLRACGSTGWMAPAGCSTPPSDDAAERTIALLYADLRCARQDRLGQLDARPDRPQQQQQEQQQPSPLALSRLRLLAAVCARAAASML